MVMQSIYLYDEVKIERTASSEIKVASNLNFLPTGDGNIAYKAAKLLKEEFHIEEGVRISLNKHIPERRDLRAAALTRRQCCSA